MFTQHRYPNNKHISASKNFDPSVIKQIIPSQHVSEHSEMMKTKETLLQGLNLLKNHLYKTFVFLLVIITTHTEQITNLLIFLIEEVHHVTVIQTETLHHKSNVALIPETDIDMKDPQFNRSRHQGNRQSSSTFTLSSLTIDFFL